MNGFHRHGVQPRMVHRRGQTPRCGDEILDLLGSKADVAEVFGQFDSIFQGASGMA